MTIIEKVYDIHHLLPRSHQGTNEKSNLVRVPQDKHRMFHGLFRNWLPPQIAKELNRLWISKKWRMIAIPVEGSGVVYEDETFIVVRKKKP